MGSLDDRIKAAKPLAPALPGDFATRVMTEIDRRGLVPAKPRPWQRWLPAGAAAVLLAAAAMLVNAAVFELRMNGSLELLYFGQRFVGDFLTRVPYDLLGAVLIAGGGAGWLLARARTMRVRLAWLLALSYGISGAGGAALAASGLNERLQTGVVEEGWDWPLLGPFYGRRAHYARPHHRFRMGRVLALQAGVVELLTPGGDTLQVHVPPGFNVRPGEHLRLRGDAVAGRFFAREAQRFQPHHAQRYFHHMRGPMGRPMGPMMRGGRPMGPMMRGGGPMHRPMGPPQRPPAP